MQWVIRAVSDIHVSPYSAYGKNTWGVNSALPYISGAWCGIKHTDFTPYVSYVQSLSLRVLHHSCSFVWQHRSTFLSPTYITNMMVVSCLPFNIGS
jgi:hypothetical protein